MTKGNIYSHLITFALPLLLGQIFQQLYNTFDTWCVGNFVGKVSFSAVGTVGSVTTLLIGFAGGFATGAGVVISQLYGAGDTEGVKKAHHTFALFIIILSLLLTLIGELIVPLVIKFLNAPMEVRSEQEVYLRIYFAGLSGLLFYNAGSSVYRAVGNSRLPFTFLVISAVLNIILDLVFVIFLKAGTAGVAYATIISQGVSAILMIITLLRTSSSVRLEIKKLKIDWGLLKKIIAIGLPSSIQMALTSFSNIFVQSYINYFGTDVMGGWTAYSKLDQLALLPMQCLGLSAMTFMGQNYGKRDLKRAKKGVNIAFLLAVISTILLIIPIEIFAPTFTSFFIDRNESEVIKYGALFLRFISPFYVLCCCNQVYGSALRGAGKSQIPMFVMLFSFVFMRQIYLFVVSRYISNTILPIAFSYPFGWIICSLLITIIYFVYINKLINKPNLESH